LNKTGTIRIALIAALALAVALTAGLAGTASAAKKKGKKSPSVFKQQVSPNLGIPDAPVAGAFTPVTSTITVSKKFKGKVVGDLDITGYQTTGSVADAADDISAVLTAPSGLTVTIFNPDNNGIGDQNIGPLTLNDDTPTSLCNSATPPCEDPQQTLNRPFAGTANLFMLAGSETGPLSAFDGTSMKGAWTLTLYDIANNQTSVLNSWGLSITPARPIAASAKTKKAGAAAKKTGAFTGSANPNAAVPDDPAMGASTPVTSTITVGKKFKKSVVGDLNVTGIRTTGNVADAPDDLEAKLTAPNGTTVRIIGQNNLGDDFPSLGPLTIDDDTSTSICLGTPCFNPLQSLVVPHAGTVNMLDLGGGGTGPLSSFNGAPMKGTWTLTVWDEAEAGQSSVLNSWGLKITPAQPVTASGKSKKAGAGKKKGKKGKSKFTGSANPNAAIPNGDGLSTSTPLTSTITVGKQFKGKTIGDLNVTGLRTTGIGALALEDLTFTLIGPTGRAVRLFDSFGLQGQALGGLTLDDDTKASVCQDGPPPCDDPIESLNPPYAGTANMRELEGRGTAPLSAFDGTRMKGTWTLHAVDEAAGDSSVLNGWGLAITAAKPVK
jgi:subtilisin-like proprotein convertase family protein